MIRILLIILVFLLFCAGCSAGNTNLPASTPTEPVDFSTPIPETAPKLPVVSPAVTEPSIPATEPDHIEVLVQSMTVEEKVGQLFLARCPDESAIEDIQNYHLGGYILFGKDFDGQTPESISILLKSYQDASKIPLLIAVDEEGGTVCRVSSHKAFRDSRFSSPRNLFSSGGMEAVIEAETEKSRLLSSLGINVNMAPVCDITTDPNAFMYKRSLGESPETTGLFIAKTVHTMHTEGVGSVLKHFPGYGNNVDTHVGIAVDNRALEELESRDLIPFRFGIQAGCDAILVSHTFVNAMDAELPASLSPAVIGYIRKEMNFDGVIVTDDLAMQAITDQYGAGESAVMAVIAGNDLLCSTEYATQYEAVLQAVKEGRITMEQLESAVIRILLWKTELGLLDPGSEIQARQRYPEF